jgi:hypothetical protein
LSKVNLISDKFNGVPNNEILLLKSEKTNVEAEVNDMEIEKKSVRVVFNSLAKIAQW